jgi:hypothetical protein
VFLSFAIKLELVVGLPFEYIMPITRVNQNVARTILFWIVLDFTIFGHEVDLFFLKLILSLYMSFFNFQASNMDLVYR